MPSLAYKTPQERKRFIPQAPPPYPTYRIYKTYKIYFPCHAESLLIWFSGALARPARLSSTESPKWGN